MSFIDNFISATTQLPSPVIWRRWTAISIIGGLMGRKFYVLPSSNRPIFPNLYILVVGNPAAGKSIIVEEAQKLWQKHGAKTSALNFTRASFLDDLRKSASGYNDAINGSAVHSLIIAPTEAGTAFPENDLHLLNTLNELYDGKSSYTEQTIARGSNTISNPIINVLGAIQPGFLIKILPDEAFKMGFASRLMLIYSDAAPHQDLFGEAVQTITEVDETTLEKIRRRTPCAMIITPEFKAAFTEAHRCGFQPAPTHPKLSNYIGRRPLTIVKLSMIYAMAENQLHMELHHLNSAIETLHEAEVFMPTIFEQMVSSTSLNARAEVLYQLRQYCKAEEVEGMPDHLFVQIVSDKVESHQIVPFINILKATQFIRVEKKGKAQIEYVIPLK